jgi:drug/metabolite transporter (DMT)-like permease
MGFGCLFSLPVFIAQQGWKELVHVSAGEWGALAYLAVLSTALAYVLYLHALSLAPASHTTAVQNLEPLAATAAGILILHEPLTLNLVIGGAAILIGTSLVQRTIRQPIDQNEATGHRSA